VVINTHGEDWGFDHQVIFATREPVNKNHDSDAKSRRLVAVTVCKFDPFSICLFGETVWAIRPSFIEAYAGKGYPDSLVMMGACESAKNTSMADAFFKHGGKAYLGYSETVRTVFVKESGTEFFHKFLEV